MKIKILFQRLSFLWIFQHFKTNKINLFNSKTLAEGHLKDRNFSLLKTCSKQLKRRHIYRLSKICPLAVWKGQKCPPGRPPGRLALTVRFLTVVPPVDRDWIQRAAALCRSTGRSTGAISREQSSLDGRPLGRPAHQPWLCARRSTDFCLSRPVRSTGRQPGQTIMGI